MNTYIAKFEFTTPLAIGGRGSRALMRSDTLFSAMCHAWASLYGGDDLERVLGAPGGRPGFVTSSMFVYSPGTYYLPKPLGRPGNAPSAGAAARLRRLDWLPLAAFKQWVQGGAVEWPRLLAEEPLAWAKTHAIVNRDRAAHDRRLQRVGAFRDYAVEFAAGCGGYAVVQAESDDVANRLSRCLLFLGETGIGGRRTIGMGQFALATGGLLPTPPDWDFMRAADAKWGVSLSLYAPTHAEAQRLGETGAYSLCTRGGWASSPQPRPPAKKAQAALVEEGALVPLPCQGQLLDVTPQAWSDDGGHPVFRCGAPVVAPSRRQGGAA